MFSKVFLLGTSSVAAVAAGVGLNAMGGSSFFKKDVAATKAAEPSCTVLLVESENKKEASIMGNLENLKETDKNNEELWNSLHEVCRNSSDRKVYVGNIGNPKKLTHQTKYQSIVWKVVSKSNG
ncbi:hypothetical protein MHC_02240 [Mycoplasma haemocanis str. Illinois]|uniref:Uncharacterized protein n=1 Tax=Mycoplasma haemocanis (strain Illinois) TaxID=1111676 RepID=H6N6P2_MYCHN|nr:hypothetical protein [Mycoplasma haemocanis]AEW45314.1 hypothetical protein MHC_02240 [Mycoplasma haemocanis str. Illinois]